MTDVTSSKEAEVSSPLIGGDPWSDGRIESTEDLRPHHDQLSFEDDFSPVTPTSNKTLDFVRMPDSNTYLSALETKLARLKGSSAGSKSNVDSSKRLLDDLMAVKEGHMSGFMEAGQRLQLSNADDAFQSASSGIHDDLPDQDFQPGAFDFIRTRIRPDRQALTAEELLALIASDFLNNSSVAAADSTENSSSTTATAAVGSGPSTERDVNGATTMTLPNHKTEGV